MVADEETCARTGTSYGHLAVVEGVISGNSRFLGSEELGFRSSTTPHNLYYQNRQLLARNSGSYTVRVNSSPGVRGVGSQRSTEHALNVLSNVTTLLGDYKDALKVSPMVFVGLA